LQLKIHPLDDPILRLMLRFVLERNLIALRSEITRKNIFNPFQDAGNNLPEFEPNYKQILRFGLRAIPYERSS